MAKTRKPVDKLKVAAFVEATHNMNLEQCRNVTRTQAIIVATMQANFQNERSKLTGYRMALDEKNTALKLSLK